MPELGDYGPTISNVTVESGEQGGASVTMRLDFSAVLLPLKVIGDEASVTVRRLNEVVDEATEVASLKLLYGEDPDVAEAAQVDVPPGAESYVFAGMDQYTDAYFWVRATDASGNVMEAVPWENASPVFVGARLEKELADANDQLVLNRDVLYFKGVNESEGEDDNNGTHVTFQDWGERYPVWIQSGTWSMSFWIKPDRDAPPDDDSFDPDIDDRDMRFLEIRAPGDDPNFMNVDNRFTTLDNQGEGIYTTNLVKGEWYFYAITATSDRITIYSNAGPDESGEDYSPKAFLTANPPPKDMNFSGMTGEDMIVGSKFSQSTQWIGWATKIYFSNRSIPLTEAYQRFMDKPR
jgi:hypothetical protein